MKLWRSRRSEKAQVGDEALRSEILARVRQILADGQPRTGRQIATILKRQELNVDRTFVNSVLFHEGRRLLKFDRRSFTYWLDLPATATEEPEIELPLGNAEVSQPERRSTTNPPIPLDWSEHPLGEHILALLDQYGPVTTTQLQAALRERGIKITGLELWRKLEALRQNREIAEPTPHATNTPSNPVYIYQLPDESHSPTSHPSATEAEAVTPPSAPPVSDRDNGRASIQIAPDDLKQAITAILSECGIVTLEELVSLLTPIGSGKPEEETVYAALKSLFQEGILAQPASSPSTAQHQQVLHFQLKENPWADQPSSVTSAPAISISPEAVRKLVVSVLEELGEATFGDIIGALEARLGLRIERVALHNHLRDLKLQGVVAEPRPHPWHTPRTPLFVYSLKQPKRDSWVQEVVTEASAKPADQDWRDQLLVATPKEDPPASQQIPGPRQRASRAAVLEEALADLGQPSHYQTIHAEAIRRIPEQDQFSAVQAYSAMFYSDRFRLLGNGVFGLATWAIHGVSASDWPILQHCPMPLLPAQTYPNAFFDSVIFGRDLLVRLPQTAAGFWRHMQTWSQRNGATASNAQDAFDAWYAAGLIERVDFAWDRHSLLTLTLPAEASLDEVREHCLNMLCQRVLKMPELLWLLSRVPRSTIPFIKKALFTNKKAGFDVPTRLMLLASFGAVQKVADEWRLTEIGWAAQAAHPPQELPRFIPETGDEEALSNGWEYYDDLGLLDV